jgi:hypothetical protein
MSKKPPTILSICIPTYNPNLEYLNSLIKPLYGLLEILPIEILISDDSSENYPELSNLLMTQYPEINVFRSRKKGMVENWNNCVVESSGIFFVVPGQDDLLDPLVITNTLQEFSNNDFDFIFTKQKYINGRDEIRRDPRLGLSKAKFETSYLRRYERNDVVRTILLHGNVISDPCGAIIRKTSWAKLMGFSTQFSHAPDADLWIRAEIDSMKVYSDGMLLASKRIHSSFATKRHITDGVASRDRELMYLQYSHLLQDKIECGAAKVRVYVHWIFDKLRGSRATFPELPSLKLGPLDKIRVAFLYIRTEFQNTISENIVR